MERMFYLLELSDCLNTADMVRHTITETELIHRIYLIRHEDRPMEAYIRILLTGVAKEPPVGLFHGPGLPAKEQPDAWEAWVQRMPSWVGRAWEGGLLEYENATRQWFREMVELLRGKR